MPTRVGIGIRFNNNKTMIKKEKKVKSNLNLFSGTLCKTSSSFSLYDKSEKLVKIGVIDIKIRSRSEEFDDIYLAELLNDLEYSGMKISKGNVIPVEEKYIYIEDYDIIKEALLKQKLIGCLENKLKDIDRKIEREKEDSKSLYNRIKSYNDEIKTYKKRIKECDANILNWKKLKSKSNPDYEKEFANQISLFNKHKKIEKFYIDEVDRHLGIIFETKSLEYIDNKHKINKFELGRYKIFVPFEMDYSMSGVNIDKHYSKRNHHPCLSEFKFCLGAEVGKTIQKMRATGNFAQLIIFLINFLEEPDYGTPHVDARQFEFAQSVTIKPTNNNDWFNIGYWMANEKWDNEKFSQEFNKKYKRGL